MEILVFGAGAVGGYLAAQLIQAEHDVSLIVRGAAAAAISQNGLAVIEDGQRVVTQPTTYNTLRQALVQQPKYDQILVCMKSYDVEAAINEMVAFCKVPPNVITFQNGIGIEELFVKEFGESLVTAASLTTPLSHESYHSIVVERSDRGLALAPVQKKSDVSQWVDLFQDAGIETVRFEDYQSMKWSKALLNMIGNATSAILNRHPRVVYSYGPTFKVEKDMLKETLAVMRKLKLEPRDLPGVKTNQLVKALRLPDAMVKPILTKIVGGGRGNKLPSFHLDLTGGKEKNEVSFHNKTVADVGLDNDVSVPVNAALADILIGIARKEIDYQRYNGQPQRLVADVDKYRQAAKSGKTPLFRGKSA
jgi:2-dehydropantoate 2-reductase